MWVVAAIVVCVPHQPCVGLKESLAVFSQPPATTEEACHVAAYDWMMEWRRRKGMGVSFNVVCEKSNAA